MIWSKGAQGWHTHFIFAQERGVGSYQTLLVWWFPVEMNVLVVESISARCLKCKCQ